MSFGGKALMMKLPWNTKPIPARFAASAVLAARWLAGRKGVFQMRDVLFSSHNFAETKYLQFTDFQHFIQ